MEPETFAQKVKAAATPELLKSLALRIVYKLELEGEQEEYLVNKIVDVEGDLNPAELNCEEFEDLLHYLEGAEVDEKGKWPRESWMYSLVNEVGGLLYDKTNFINAARTALLCCLYFGKKDSTFFINRATAKKVQKCMQKKTEPAPPALVQEKEKEEKKPKYKPEEVIDRMRDFLSELN